MTSVRTTIRGRRHVFFGWLFISLAGLALALALSACGSFTPQTKDTPLDVVFDAPMDQIAGGVRLSDPANSMTGYGGAVDVRGEVIAIGAPGQNQSNSGLGLVHVYRLAGGTWREEAPLTAGDGIKGKVFGGSVAVSEGLIAVGAPGPWQNVSGAVYVFEYDGQTWMQTAKLTPDPADGGMTQKQVDWPRGGCAGSRPFGALVALDGDTLAVGGDATPDSVHIYQRGKNGWQEQARIPIPSVPGRSLCVASLAVWGDTLALSAFYAPPQPELAQFSMGNVTAYVFERAGSTWKENFRFAPDSGKVDYAFLHEAVATSVALSGSPGQADLLAVGLPGFPDWSQAQSTAKAFLWGANADKLKLPESPRQAGAVYLFERGENGVWRQQATLRPAGWDNPPGPGSFPVTTTTPAASLVIPGDMLSGNPEISFFGATVDLDGNRLAVTAEYANATYVFERRGQSWVYWLSISPPKTGEEAWEDWSQGVRLSGDTLLLGTPGDLGDSAYAFNLCAQSSGNCK